MEIQAVSWEDYSKAIRTMVTVFDKPQFHLLNTHRCDKIFFFLGVSTKLKFGLIGGVRDTVFSAPFSAPYACVSPLERDVGLSDLYDFFASIDNYLRQEGITEVRYILPPSFYQPSLLASVENVLFQSNYSVCTIDLNYQYDLSKFGNEYIEHLDSKARQKLRAGIKNKLEFFAAAELATKETAYEIISKNRAVKGYPLKLSWADIVKNMAVIQIDFFLVLTEDQTPIASALCFYVSASVVQIVYWGDLPSFSGLRPMNFLAYKIFQHYEALGLKVVDIGPSTDGGVPNFGLCDFKQAIGCDIASKYTFSKKLI